MFNSEKFIILAVIIFMYLVGFSVGNIITEKRNANKVTVALQGMSLDDVVKMREECEKALPRNKYCEMTFTPSEVFNERMVEKLPGSPN